MGTATPPYCKMRGRCPSRYQLAGRLPNHFDKWAKMGQHLTMKRKTNIAESAAAGAAAAVVTGNPAVGAVVGLWDHSIQSSAADAVALAVEAEVRRRERELSRTE